MKIGYLGPVGTFSYEICNHLYQNEEKIPFKTITELIKSLENAQVDEVIVPIENSLQGCVTETIDAIINSKNIYICAEQILSINQNLMASEMYKYEEIEEIYSHPQALAQASKFLNTHFKHISIIEVSSTAQAASYVAKKKNAACIASLECAKLYDLQIIAKSIQDNNNNKTKFWCLNKKRQRIKNANKMTLIFSTKHIPGALYKALSVFEKNNLNLTKIESRPTKNELGEYYFLVDVEVNDNYEKALKELLKVTTTLKVLGIYEKRD